MTDDYDVGYKKPPEHTQFKKGQSGNPKGRPPKKREVEASDITALLTDLVTVQKNGKTVEMSPKQVQLHSLMRKVEEKEDMRAAERLFKEFNKHNCMPKPERLNTSQVVQLPSTPEQPFSKSLFIFKLYGRLNLSPEERVLMEELWKPHAEQEERDKRVRALSHLKLEDEDD